LGFSCSNPFKISKYLELLGRHDVKCKNLRIYISFFKDITNDSLSGGSMSMDSTMFQNVRGTKILMKKYIYNRKSGLIQKKAKDMPFLIHCFKPGRTNI
jgi:hypothetical protein